MQEPFTIPLTDRGREYEFKARFERWGYTHRIAVLVGETTFTFEPDEEGGYRALVTEGDALPEGPDTLRLLQAIAEKLAELSR